jgi:hypothetical protein
MEEIVNNLTREYRNFRFSEWLGFVSVLLMVFVGASPAIAQLSTGTISGTATDQSGAAIPGVGVAIKNVETGVTRNLDTNEVGRYDAAALPVGTYEVTGTLPGFRTLVHSGIVLTVGRNAVVDLVLEVGEVTESITVAGEVSQVETTTATVSNLVDAKRVLEIPLNNRDLTQLAFLQPGVLRVPQLAGNTNQQLTYIGGMGDKMSVGGARGSQNVYLVDGISNSDLSGNAQGAAGNYAGAESVKEFQVITNNYSAEYASRPGAIVSAVTKSGTNSFHGSLFEFLRNDNLDAPKWEDNAFGRTQPEFKRNQFGGSLGGPIVRDRTFFFGSYEALRERQGITDTAVVPTAQARVGNLGPNGPRNPADPNGIWPVNPIMVPYLRLYPLPGEDGTTLVTDFGDGRALVAGTARTPVNDDFGTVKIDHQFASQKKGSIAATYSIDDASASIFRMLRAANSFRTTSRKHVVSVRHTSILSPSTLNEFGFGYTAAKPVGGIPIADINWSSFQGADLRFHPEKKEMGSLSPGNGVSGIGYSDGQTFLQQNLWTLRDSLSLTRQKHTMKLGAEFLHYQYPMTVNTNFGNGTYTFTGLDTFLQGRPRQLTMDLPKGALVLGLPAQQDPNFDLRQSVFGFYFQDNYQVLPSLTLNMGLRYEFMTDVTEKRGHLSTVKNFFDTQLIVGQKLFKNPTKRNFSPRLGFAWAPGDRKTSLRGGFGIYYDVPLLFHWQYNFGTMPPFLAQGQVTDTASSGFLRFPDAFTRQPQLLQATPQLRIIEYDQKPTYIYRWSLTLDREIGPWLFSAGYTGSRGLHLWVQFEGNMSKWDGWPNQVPSLEKRFRASNGDINPNIARLTVQAPSGNSYYHGLALNATRRVTAGLQFQAAYTFSKNIDQGATSANIYENLPQAQRWSYYWDRQLVRGLSALDIRHSFVTNLTYDLPRTRLTGIAGGLINGWQVSGILTRTSGSPFTIGDGTTEQNVAFVRIEGLRPNLIPGGNNNPILGGPDRYYDPTQFVSSMCRGGRDCRPGDPDYQTGYFGNLGYNTVTGPGFATFDFSLLKNVPLSESTRLQFRSEFFNLFNHPNFALPDSTPFLATGARDPQAGRITQTRATARQIQFAMKFIF